MLHLRGHKELDMTVTKQQQTLLDVSYIPGTILGEGDGTPLQYSCLENPMDRGARYAEYIMRNAGLHEAQAGIKIAKRNIDNLRYADDHPYGIK